MRMYPQIAFAIAALGMSSAALAATGNYTKSARSGTVYQESVGSSAFFTAGGLAVPSTGQVTTVQWTGSTYTNGFTKQVLELCYTPQYSSTVSKCVTLPGLSGSTNAFAGFSARGAFSIKYTLTGGTYPADPSGSSSILVAYNY